jgi:signal transduction histidine kinase
MSVRVTLPISRAIQSFFLSLKIRHKLTVIMMVTSGLALLVSGFSSVIVSNYMLLKELEIELISLARITGYNCQAALEFRIQEDVERLLAGLQEKPSIHVGAILDPQGKPFAVFQKMGLDHTPIIPDAPAEGMVIVDEFMHIFLKIRRDEKFLGTLYLRDDMRALRTTHETAVWMVFLVLLVALTVVYFFAGWLQGLISGPILNLAQTAKTVSEQKNYSIRATRGPTDEIGWLIQSFNEMLEQIQLREADLVRSNQELEQFAYISSHDLQEPLRMVTSYLQLLKRRYKDELDGQAQEFIDFAVSGAKRMQELIHDLLVFSRIGNRPIEMRTINLNLILEEVLVTFGPKIQTSGAKITLDELPKIMAEGKLLAQLFQNLIGNALKYHGQEKTVIHIGASSDDEEWTIRVEDNGIGIDPQFFQKVFIIFQRLHTRQEYPGTGIGLSICKRIIERHGGRIWIETKNSPGTVFCFTLPRSPEDPDRHRVTFA